MRDDKYVMWLSRVEGMGIKKQQALMEEFVSAEEIFRAPRQLLKAVGCLNDHQVNKIISAQDSSLLDKYCEELEKNQIRCISINNEEYPSLLREIYDPPQVIYVVGNIPDDDLPRVSIIGSRKCSEYGLTVARRISKDLAARGVIIVSGMAYGIDSMAHKGALEGDGFTIAVLGFGPDRCYPAQNRGLRDQISRSGCLISEYPPGVGPMPAHFPARNRIISGLSSATLVVEAGKKSGTLITVTQALEQGREVYAIPGNITSKLSEGTNALIKDGATPVSDAEDVINAMGLTYVADFQATENAGIKTESLAQEEKLVYDCINFEPVSAEYIMTTTKSEPSAVLYILALLEFRGLVKRIPGQKYIRS